LIALREMTSRLGEDHANARTLAEGLAQIPCIQIDLSRVQTNMVFFDLHPEARLTPAELTERLKAEYDIYINAYPGKARTFRAVTHYWITPERIEITLDAIRTLLA